MYLYKSYCYETLQEIADSIQSTVFFGDGFVIDNVSVGLNTVVIDSIKLSTHYFYTVIPPLCSEIGFNNSYSGLTVSDSLELWGLSLVVLVAAFAVKVLKRAL